MIKKFDEFHLNEDGVASATMGNSNGMGAVVAPTVGAVPGQVWGAGSGTPGSGDVVASNTNVYTKQPAKFKRKSKRRKYETNDKSTMYITKYTDWQKPDGTDKVPWTISKLTEKTKILRFDAFESISNDEFITNRILDKISKDGMKSLSPEEKDILDKYSKGKKIKNVQEIETEQDDKFIHDESSIKDIIADIPITFKLSRISENKNGEEYVYGVITFGDKEYRGSIYFNNDIFKYAEFENENSDIYTDLEGLEQELDSYFQNIVDMIHKHI